MELSESQFALTRRALLGELGEPIIDMMFGRQSGHPAEAYPLHIRHEAEKLAWMNAQSGKLTDLGWLAADSCREYRFWLERSRRLPFEGAADHLAASHFSGKSVLEIGCGMGTNLMSLQETTGRLVGIEPIGVYRQLGEIFAERENRPAPEICAGMGEAIPADDAQFDCALCVSSFQYVDGAATLREVARVLKPGGELVVIGGTLGVYWRSGLTPLLLSSARDLKAYGITILNTLSYMASGRRLIMPRGVWSTAAPVYPTTGFTSRQIERFGLKLLSPPVSIPPETCFWARKTLEWRGAPEMASPEHLRHPSGKSN